MANVLTGRSLKVAYPTVFRGAPLAVGDPDLVVGTDCTIAEAESLLKSNRLTLIPDGLDRNPFTASEQIFTGGGGGLTTAQVQALIDSDNVQDALDVQAAVAAAIAADNIADLADRNAAILADNQINSVDTVADIPATAAAGQTFLVHSDASAANHGLWRISDDGTPVLELAASGIVSSGGSFQTQVSTVALAIGATSATVAIPTGFTSGDFVSVWASPSGIVIENSFDEAGGNLTFPISNGPTTATHTLSVRFSK